MIAEFTRIIIINLLSLMHNLLLIYLLLIYYYYTQDALLYVVSQKFSVAFCLGPGEVILNLMKVEKIIKQISFFGVKQGLFKQLSSRKINRK